MKRFVAAARSAVAFLFVSLMFTAMAEVTPDEYAKKLTITLSDAIGEVALTDFPVLVRLSESILGFKYTDFKEAKGADMIFTDEEGNLLSHEVDTWDAFGTSLVWVKIPSAQAGVKIVCYFGGPSAAETVDPTDVWSNYTGVWHMGETKEGTYNDKTYTTFPNATGLEGTDGLIESEGVTKSGAAGVIGHSVDIASTVKAGSWLATKARGGVYVPYSSALKAFGTFTLSFWVKVGAGHDGDTWVRMCGNEDSNSAQQKGFRLDFADLGSGNGGKSGGGAFKAYAAAGKIDTYQPLNPALTSSSWTHLVFVFGDKWLTYYENGQLVKSQVKDSTHLKTAVNDSECMLGLGNFGTTFGNANLQPFPGFFDECRISSGERLAANVAAEYAMVANPELMEYGYVEDVGLVYYPVNLTVPSGSVTYSVEPHHYQDEVPCFLSGTELTITAVDETAVRFRKWRGDTENAIIDENKITVLVLNGLSLEPVWAHAWKLASDRKSITDGVNTLAVTSDNSDGKVKISSGNSNGVLDLEGEVDLSLPIVGPTGEEGVWWLSGVGDGAFYKNTNIVTVILPDTQLSDEKRFTSIGENAFRDCSELKKVTPFLPVTVSSLGTRAFNACSSLKGDLRLECPALTKNPQNGFQDCNELTSIYLPYIINMHENGWVYGGLGNVTNITLSVNKIDFNGSSPFANLTTKCEVYFPGKAPVFTSGDRPFGKDVKGLVIYCDPVIDPKGWAEVETLNWVKPSESSKWFKFVKVEDDPTMTTAEDYPGPKTIGRFMGEDGGSGSSYYYWLVAYKSPFRKPGLLLLVR